MKELVWLTLELVSAVHEEQQSVFGGPSGVRDPGALESAVGRARNKWLYEQAELPELAAACAFGIARNHAFVDGNKRMALLGLIIFHGLNEIDFMADEAEAVVIIRDVAAGKTDETGLSRWIRDNWPEQKA